MRSESKSKSTTKSTALINCRPNDLWYGSSLGWRLALVPQFDPRIHPSASIRWRMAATCAGQLLFILTICEAGRWTFSWITQSSCHGWLPANVAYCFATFFPHPWSKSRGSCTCRWPPMTMTAMMTPPRFNSPGETLPLPHPLRLRWVGGSTVRWFSGCCCYASIRFHYKARVPQLPL